MDEVIRYNKTDALGRELFSIHIPSLANLPRLSLPGKRFACLVACDVSSSSEDDLQLFAHNLIEQGVAYVCAWGPGCRKMEVAVDHADHVETIEQPVILTTSHENKAIDEALWYLFWCAYPDKAYIEECRSALVIVVANESLHAHVRMRLSDPQSLAEAK